MSEVTNLNEATAKETANEYAKPIVLRFKDTNTEYTLEFNRATVTLAEKRGFPLTPMNPEVVTQRPAEVIPDLFRFSLKTLEVCRVKCWRDLLLFTHRAMRHSSTLRKIRSQKTRTWRWKCKRRFIATTDRMDRLSSDLRESVPLLSLYRNDLRRLLGKRTKASESLSRSRENKDRESEHI